MDDIRSSAAAICMVSAGICAVRSLVSGSALSKKTEIILKMIFAIVLFAPVINGCLDAELPHAGNYELMEYGYSREKYADELMQQTSVNLSDVVLQQMEANGVFCRKADVIVNISEDGSIFISKVIVSTDDNEKAAEIIRNCFGPGTEVVYEDN